MAKVLLIISFVSIAMLHAGRAAAQEEAVDVENKIHKPGQSDNQVQSAKSDKTTQTESPKAPANQSKPNKTATAQVSQKKPPTVFPEKKQQSPAFIDRDGDGIRDGKEHRFRRRSPRNSESNSQQMKQRRKQNSAKVGSGTAGN